MEPAASQPATSVPATSVIVQRGMYLDEFVVGARYLHRPGRTVTDADNVLFTTLTMNTQARDAGSVSQRGSRGATR